MVCASQGDYVSIPPPSPLLANYLPISLSLQSEGLTEGRNQSKSGLAGRGEGLEENQSNSTGQRKVSAKDETETEAAALMH